MLQQIILQLNYGKCKLVEQSLYQGIKPISDHHHPLTGPLQGVRPVNKIFNIQPVLPTSQQDFQYPVSSPVSCTIMPKMSL